MKIEPLFNRPCSVCQDVLQNQRGLYQSGEGEFRHDHHKSAGSLQRSSDQPCYICSTVWTSMSAVERNETVNAHYRGHCTTLCLLSPDVMAPGSDEYKDVVFLIVEVNRGDEDLATGKNMAITSVMFLVIPSEHMEKYNVRQPLETNTGSEASWALASGWLSNCLKMHKRCNAPEPQLTNWYPTRLLDIGHSADSRIRLIETHTTRPEGPYVTLSHRWGTSHFIQLRCALLPYFQQSIPPHDLPSTFLDAIQIARRLGARYIWIDSLCIIQDSRADWLHEAALMEHVYSSSLCNISATHGRPSSTGLFSNRDPTLLYPCKTVMSWNGGPKREYQVHHTSLWTNEVVGAPLNQRAWVVQERLLAPRILHFGARQLLWECREHDAAEAYPAGLPQTLASGQAFYKSLDPLSVDEPQRDDKRRRERETSVFHGWNRVLEAYSNSLLTKPEDKLVALSGIVRKTQAVMASLVPPPSDDAREAKASHGAGLWLDHLPNQLLWFVRDCRQCDGQPSVRRAVPYRAPSFSWASVDGSITPGWFKDAEDTVELAEVVEAFIEPETRDNPAGPVKSGFVRLRGMLRKLRLSRMETMPAMWNVTIDGSLLDSEDYRDDEPRIFSPQVMLDVDQPAFDEEQQARLYCMPVEGKPQVDPGRSEPNSRQKLRTLMGLVLVAVGDSSSGCFERLGVFAANRQVHIEQLLAHNKAEERASSFPSEVYDAQSARHIVRII